MRKGYCIIAITKESKMMFYKNGIFTEDYKDCTIFEDHREALQEWFDIDKSKYKRVFVPIYDENFFAHIKGEKNEQEQKKKTQSSI